MSRCRFPVFILATIQEYIQPLCWGTLIIFEYLERIYFAKSVKRSFATRLECILQKKKN